MRAATRLAGLCCAVAVAASACSSTEAAVADPSPTAVATPSPSPSPSPTPPPVVPVTGERIVTTVDVGDGALLGPDDRGAVDEAAIAAFSGAVLDWLDAQLTALQAGPAAGGGPSEGTSGDPSAGTSGDPSAGTSGDASEAAAAAAATAATAPHPALGTLAGPDLPVQAARYELTAYHDAAAEFARVGVTVTGPDGAARGAVLVFAPGADGAPELVLFGPEVAP